MVVDFWVEFGLGEEKVGDGGGGDSGDEMLG